MRAVKNNLPTSSGEVGESEGPRPGKESVLADSGLAGEITVRVGRVRSLDFFSILNSFTVCEAIR